MKLIYFLYLLKRTDWTKFWSYLQHYSVQLGQSQWRILLSVLNSFLRFNTAFLDYFYFDFPNKSLKEQATYADTLSLYRIQKKLNRKEAIMVFKDKVLFYKIFSEFTSHAYFLPGRQSEQAFAQWLSQHNPEYIIAKNSTGQVGAGIEKFKVSLHNQAYRIGVMEIPEFYRYLKKVKLDLVEECIVQHDILQQIYPSSLNTIRVITLVTDQQEVNVLGAIIRIGLDKVIDNFDAGGISAKINMKSGLIEGPALLKDPRFKLKDNLHPITGSVICGQTVPFWNATLEMVKKAALQVPEVRTVGWDVAITNEGPFLLEGNHNWDKTHWQKSYGKGLKNELKEMVAF